MKKINKTKIKPAYTVNLTNIGSARDVYAQFGAAKLKAGLPVTNVEMSCMFEILTDATIAAVIDVLFNMTNGLVLEDGKLTKVQLKSYEIGDDEMIVVKDGNVKIKKKNIFKRFWNWITRKK